MLPDIMDITRELRDRFPYGLVNYVGGASVELQSAQPILERLIVEAVETRNFLDASYEVHDAVARSIDIATEEWLRRGANEDPRFTRLTDLTDPERKIAFGSVAAQKRISSAMIQTAHISASFEAFIARIMQKQNNMMPSAHEMTTIHGNSSVTAARMTELHLLRTRPMRKVLGSEQKDNGIIQRYTDCTGFDIIGDRLELVGDSLVSRMREMPVDTTDGRIGCPGKRHITSVWNWLSDVSSQYSYPILDAARSEDPVHRVITL